MSWTILRTQAISTAEKVVKGGFQKRASCCGGAGRDCGASRPGSGCGVFFSLLSLAPTGGRGTAGASGGFALAPARA
eukprot:11631716-Prorocentrum_lima.AAC.1